MRQTNDKPESDHAVVKKDKLGKLAFEIRGKRMLRRK